MTVSAPALGEILELDLDLQATPHLLLWQDFTSADGVFALKPTAPGRDVATAVRQDGVRHLAPTATVDTELRARWRSASRTPRHRSRTAGAHTAEWWRDAVTYHVYLRSFADGNADGVGDLAGLRSRLGHLVDLGVDALWIGPWYPSPLADGGYDVSNHRDIHPVYGTLDEAETLLHEAHARGLRVLLDVVPNHTSSEHPWFRAALAAAPGSPERDHYIFRAGRGPNDMEPPNNWRSEFGDDAWTRVTEPDGTPGEWYLHLFDHRQPDLNWRHPDVLADFETTLRFWFDRGADGFRIDVANGLCKADGLPDLTEDMCSQNRRHPYLDRDEVHEIYRSWRAIADEYRPTRILVAEAWVHDAARLARYLRPDELHAVFNDGLLEAAWLADDLRSWIETTVAGQLAADAPPAWLLSNHDVARHVSRLARAPARGRRPWHDDVRDLPSDLSLGLRRARAAALLMLSLPGSVYLYQGEELGLPEAEDIPTARLDDPTWESSGRTKRGRDGCRVPLP